MVRQLQHKVWIWDNNYLWNQLTWMFSCGICQFCLGYNTGNEFVLWKVYILHQQTSIDVATIFLVVGMWYVHKRTLTFFLGHILLVLFSHMLLSRKWRNKNIFKNSSWLITFFKNGVHNILFVDQYDFTLFSFTTAK